MDYSHITYNADDDLRTARRKATARVRTRRQLEMRGEPIPPELERIRGRTPRKYRDADERREAANRATKRYKRSDGYRETLRGRRDHARLYVDSQKQNPCSQCGGKFLPICMDWHHKEAESKIKGGVSRLVRQGAPLSRIQAELDKCELICSNCHRLMTTLESGSTWPLGVGTWQPDVWPRFLGLEDAIGVVIDSQ